MRRELYFGDNLDVLREHIADDSVDLIYLDPPFNSNASYNMLFKDKSGDQSEAQIQAFDDTWTWGHQAEEAMDDIMRRPDVPLKLQQLMPALRSFLGTNDMMAYLAMMAVRLVELHRVLKETGSLYLHCDPTASHYLKLVLDAVFGAENYRNEIIWKRTSAHSSAKRWGDVHDTLLFYSKTNAFVWNEVLQSHSVDHIGSKYKKKDSRGPFMDADLTGSGKRSGTSGQPWRGHDPDIKGRHWAIPSMLPEGVSLPPQWSALPTQDKLDWLDQSDLIYWPSRGSGFPRYKKHLSKGVSIQGVISDISALNSQAQERLGYPTQKPLALLERIISASSNPGDVVLDPFCGCGTAVDAAETLGRAWIGIDVTHLAIGLIERRMRDRHPHLKKKGAYKVIGTPTTIGGARRLFAESPFQFERWAVSLIPGAREYKSGGGGDGGIDGLLYYQDAATRDYRQGLLSVKGGKSLSPTMVRDLRGTVERVGDADFGIFISLHEPTQGMKSEAASAGFFETGGKRIPVMQTITVEDLLDGRLPQLPGLIDESVVFKKAPKAKKKSGQGKLL